MTHLSWTLRSRYLFRLQRSLWVLRRCPLARLARLYVDVLLVLSVLSLQTQAQPEKAAVAALVFLLLPWGEGWALISFVVAWDGQGVTRSSEHFLITCILVQVFSMTVRVWW